jgi:sirohydrochlorin ferrochelatase
MTDAPGILLIAHGSPREESNADIWRVVESLRASKRYAIVEAAFLDCNEPDIAEGFRRCAKAPCSKIIAVPYFLHLGKHVALDVPRQLKAAAAMAPHVSVLMTAFLGQSQEITNALVHRALSSLVDKAES